MRRRLEPELMEDEASVAAYAAADFSRSNCALVEIVRERAGAAPACARAVDLGCGPGDVTVRMARAMPGWRIDAVDGSMAMLRHARRAVAEARLGGRVRLVCAHLPSAALVRAGYDVITSNSLLHHLHDPLALWRSIPRLAAPAAEVVMMDLRRPASPEQARALVETHAGDEPDILKEDYYRSLLAALTPGEVERQLASAGLGALRVEQVSDRHLLVWGRLTAR